MALAVQGLKSSRGPNQSIDQSFQLMPKNSTDLKKELAFRASVEKIDQLTDLALLKIKNPPRNLAHLDLGDVSTLAVGQDVHAIGHPNKEYWTLTKGIISQVRDNYAWDIHRARVIQTQTPINPGNSGGATAG